MSPLRKQFERSPFRQHWALKPDVAFLNHGSFGACPKAILDLQTQLRAEMEAEPVQFLWRRFEERLDPARNELAKFIGVAAKDLVFASNATTGVNAVVRSLDLKPGDEILATNQDYNACHNVLVEAVRRTGAKLIVAKIPFPLRNEGEILEAIIAAATPRTRLAMIDHVTSDTALIYPIAQIVRQLSERGIDTLVDGAHAPGMLPLNVREIGAAYYTGNLHKWVCAPKGAAFLWVREDKQSEVQPPVISHGNNRLREGHSAFQDRFDWPGTFDPTACLCVPEAIAFMGKLLPGGWPELRKRNNALAVEARRVLCERLNVEAPCPETMLGSIAAIPLPEKFQGVLRSSKIDPEQLRLYDEFGIEVPFNRIGEKRSFRISAQIYNSLAEFESLAQSIIALRT